MRGARAASRCASSPPRSAAHRRPAATLLQRLCTRPGTRTRLRTRAGGSGSYLGFSTMAAGESIFTILIKTAADLTGLNAVSTAVQSRFQQIQNYNKELQNGSAAINSV